MKAKYIRDDQEVSHAFYHKIPEFIEQGLVEYRDVMRDGEVKPVAFFKMGAEVEGPDVHWLVRFGVAIPADEACAVRARMSPEKMQAAQRAQELMARHIEPEDGDLFDAGVIEGVDPVTGDYIQGENWDRLSEFRTVPGVLSDEPEDDDI